MGPRSMCESPGKATDLGGGHWARQIQGGSVSVHTHVHAHVHAEHGVGRAWDVCDQLWGHMWFWVGEGLGHVLGCPRIQVRPVVGSVNVRTCVCVRAQRCLEGAGVEEH